MGNLEVEKAVQKNSKEIEMEKMLMNKLCYIESCEIARIGQAQIYRFKQSPYDYLMKYTRIFGMDDPHWQSYERNVKNAAELHHRNIAKIHHHKLQTKFYMCNKSVTISTYCNYYAITLKQILQQRRKDDIRFTAGQIWYVLKSLLEISTFLREQSFNYSNYRSSSITLSSEGYLKVYVLNLNTNAENKDNSYYEVLSDRSNISNYLPLPPQFLSCLKQGHFNINFQPEKQDSFFIASIILEMMIDEDIRKYYSVGGDQFCTYKQSTVWKDLCMLKYIYGEQLISIMEKMLSESPQKRIKPNEVLQRIEKQRENINISGSIRMFEDDNNKIKPKLSYRTSFDYEALFLKTIEPNILQNKLTAVPIRAITKKIPNRTMGGVSLTSSKQKSSSKQSIETKDKSYFRERSSLFRGNSLNTKLMLR